MSSPYPPAYRPSPSPGPSSSRPPNPYDRPPTTSPSNGFQPALPYQPSSQSQYNPNVYNAPYSGPGAGPGRAVQEMEEEEDGGSLFDFKKMKSWRFWLRKEWIPWYIIGLLLVVLTALMTIYHKQIVQWLTPAATWMRDLPAGWVIPVVILFVISFPPLFGHEIVAVLCGVVWGLWIGFGIVALGTFLGEVGNFYAFKYCCHSRSEKHERSTPWYACLARVVREGGFKIALIARLSAIPGHFTTAVFATCGMSIWVFCLAAALSLPKQFVTVYLGYILQQSGEGNSEPTSSKIISDVIVAISILITVFAAWYIWHKMQQVRPEVMREMRRQKRAGDAFTYKAPPGAEGSAENLWSTNDFAASEMTLTDPSKPSAPGGGKPYTPYSSGREDAAAPLFRPNSSDLPPGAAAPILSSAYAAGVASGSGRNTPQESRRYAPPSAAAYGASTDDLPMEPMRPAPGSLDQGYAYAPSPAQQVREQYLSPRVQGRPLAQAQDRQQYQQQQQQQAYAPPAGYPTQAQSYAQSYTQASNPFDDQHVPPSHQQQPQLKMPVPQAPVQLQYAPPAGPPAFEDPYDAPVHGQQTAYAPPAMTPAQPQPQPQQGQYAQPQQQQGQDAPFAVMTATGAERPRGVQLRDG
ncbi:hypothetical protein CALCODRAFT_503146 [Calocera cornea HHB12733]|uniref:Golgi apparatus membrane protein TVP38 n=1 Tax=Calocera cornea HHB12733 TaxID=1353952 RepID=A0A165CZC5_9BASI|nr:hypothetical protein CALCODRAFT_503146 [Calocera cornea HHB12733]